MAFDFYGKKVLVTGAGRGIGRGIALRLAKAGCKVYALDCNKDALETLAGESESIVTIHQDLTDWEGTKATLEELETLDRLVNNAALVLGLEPALDQPKADLEKYMAVNMLAAINCIQAVGKKMLEEGRQGSVVNMSSQTGHQAYPNTLGYSISKAGLDMVTKQFALELGPFGIRVNSVVPTLVKTEAFKSLMNLQPDIGDTCVERTPMLRLAEVEEIVSPVMYLLSDYATMVTGTTHFVDGGIACNITTRT